MKHIYKISISLLLICIFIIGLYKIYEYKYLRLPEIEFYFDEYIDADINYKILVNNEEVFRDKNKLTSLTMNTLYPTTIQIGKQTKNILIPKLKKDSYIPIIIHNKNQIKKLKLYTLPSDFPKFNLDNKQDIKGYILTSFHGLKLIHPSYAMIIDTNDNLVWYRGNPIKVLSSFHLQQHNINHKLRYSMHIQTDRFSDSIIRGKHLLLDEKFSVIDTIEVMKTDKHPSIPADEHEFVYIDDKHYIVIGYQYKKKESSNTDKIETYTAAIIQEQKDGKVVFEWLSDEHPELFSSCIEECKENPGYHLDYMHINSIDIDPKDNNLIISSASGYYIAKINRISGDVMWKLGGIKDEFNLPDNYKFIRQHDAQVLENNQIMLFDNGISKLTTEDKLNNNINEHDSRILKFQIDEKNRKIVDIIEIPIHEKSQYMGSVQELNDNMYFIGCGNAENCSAKLINSKSDKLLVLKVNKPYFSYRAYFTDKIKE